MTTTKCCIKWIPEMGDKPTSKGLIKKTKLRTGPVKNDFRKGQPLGVGPER